MSSKATSSVITPAAMFVSQVCFSLPAYPRGCHLITRDIKSHLTPHLRWCHTGTLHLFLQHTSASLTINENADKDVRADMEMWLNMAVSEKTQWKHDAEGR
jgi:secondary thiamine-phosphate synthase enzyme